MGNYLVEVAASASPFVARLTLKSKMRKARMRTVMAVVWQTILAIARRCMGLLSMKGASCVVART